MKTIEISSYPKSGNTWFLSITENYLKKLSGVDFYPANYRNVMTLEDRKERSIYIKEIDDSVVFYKSHVHNNSLVDPDKIIHIYRHPLDVFLSSLNHLNNNSSKFSADKKNKLFIDGIPKSVEQIVEDGQLDHYFEVFLKNVGSNYWSGVLKKSSNYFKYVQEALDCDKTYSIRYEDLVDDTALYANAAISSVLGLVESVDIDIDKINQKTKNSQNSKFFWKSKPKNYIDMLTPDQINRFETKYSKELSAIGYL